MLAISRRFCLLTLALVLFLLASSTQVWAVPWEKEMLARATTKTCTSCNGSGYSWSREYAPRYDGIRAPNEPCNICGSTGERHWHKPCYSCKGTGSVKTVDTSKRSRSSDLPSLDGGSITPAPDALPPGIVSRYIICPKCRGAALCVKNVYNGRGAVTCNCGYRYRNY